MIHPTLKNDCLLLGCLPLCHVLLMNDANYPWCILVPDREGVSEIYQLSPDDQQRLTTESSALGECLMQIFNGDKLNIGALGNVVPQLHVHHIVRYRTDPTWPAPVWGKLPGKAYTDQKMSEIRNKICENLGKWIEFTADSSTQTP